MEAIPLIPKAKVLPNLDATPLIKELFQNEFQAVVPTKKHSQNILTSYQYSNADCTSQETFRGSDLLKSEINRSDSLIEFAGNVLEAYVTHQKNLEDIRNAEKHVFETYAHFLNRNRNTLKDEAVRDLLHLKRLPLFKSLDKNYVEKYKLLQGEAGLPFEYEVNLDFRVRDFKKWRRKLENTSEDNGNMGVVQRAIAPLNCKNCPKNETFPEKRKKVRKPRPKNKITDSNQTDVLRAEPKIIFFTDYKLGDVYTAEIKVKNFHTKKIKFQLKPMYADGPFRATLNENCTTTVFPGLSFHLTVEFSPKSLENAAEDVVIITEDGNRLLIPLIAYLEPPVLKTHKEVDEFTKVTAEKVASSYIECGVCFTGDTKVTKLKFRCYRGSGEFFIMSSENWSRNCINTVTSDNLLEVLPFRVYPVFFKIEKDEVIDLFVEFLPKTSGTHVENLIIACDNGQVRSLDLLGDAVGWHSYYFSIQDSLLKKLSVEQDDDLKVKYYIDFEDTTANGKVEKKFCVSNNSNMAFEFQWKIREANILSNREKYLKISKYEVKIDPESGTFKPHSIWEFLVSITFNNAQIGNYRMVLSLYVLNLPYQCIEEDATVIQPTGIVRNLYSQSLYGEEEGSAFTPELTSLQGTYESLQESIKTYVEGQNKTSVAPRYDFCKTVCAANPGLCAKPLKKSKTFFNIGEDESQGNGSRLRTTEGESSLEFCNSNPRDDRRTESSPQRNEVIWDFVDVLVDEVEIWVEVVPTRVTLEPSFIEFNTPLNVNDDLVYKEVRIVNHNQCPVTCSWIIKEETSLMKRNPLSEKHKNESASFDLLFNKKPENENQKTSDDSLHSRKYQQQCHRQWKSLENSDSKDINNKPSQPCRIIIIPNKPFTVSGLSDFTCQIGVSASQPGEFSRTFCLNVNDGDLILNMNVSGKAVKKSFHVYPYILDFGLVKQGSRPVNYFSIINESPSPMGLSWKINHYKYDFDENKFSKELCLKEKLNYKQAKEIMEKKENSITKPFYLNAKMPGVKFELLEIVENTKVVKPSEQYVMILGEVKTPKLSLYSSRFENAILAPQGMMYVGVKISKLVTLKNVGSVEALFTWGHSFGCHSRKIKVEITPKSFIIKKKSNLTINIDLTALEEGIISHCYIPCFYCRNAEPLILSVVAIASNVNVTFEVIDYPLQTHMDPETFLKSPFYHTVLRVPWPVKTYDATLALRFINESDLLNMKCQCQEVEEEAARAFDESKQDSAPGNCISSWFDYYFEIVFDKILFENYNLKQKPATAQHIYSSFSRLLSQYSGVTDFEKSVRSSPSFEISDEGSQKSKKSVVKSFKTAPSEDLKLSNLSLSGSSALESKKSEENSFPLNGMYNFMESLPLKTHLDFFNVPYQTPILRQFVIRNETPIESDFQINVSTYGVSEKLPDRRLERIRDRIFGCAKDDFQNKLMKDQPLVIIVEPSKGKLESFDAVCINVYCYGNTWGEYRDHLICQVRGVEPFHLKMSIQIVGHPIHFPMFKTQESQKPILRFHPINYIECPTSKTIKVVNRSCISMNVSWMVFLTKPLSKEEEKEESYNLAIDSNTNFDSTHSGEESTSSSKNYIPKNTSESILAFPNVTESKDMSQNSEPKYFGKTEMSSLPSLGKKEKGESSDLKKKSCRAFSSEDTKSDSQRPLFPGKPDTRIFRVEPKEMYFDPFEEKKIAITFDPQSFKFETFPQEFQGVLANCVKLKPEDQKCSELYYRPCGINFVSELMDLNALVDIPLVSFEILRGDLKFVVDSNAVTKAGSKNFSILRTFLIKNVNEKSLTIKIEIHPGVIFRIKKINTLDSLYLKYNPAVHNLKIEPGHTLEVELECFVTYKNITYAFEELKLERKKKQYPLSTDMKTSRPSLSLIDFKDGRQTEREPWKQYLDNSVAKQKSTINSNFAPKDSFEINLNRLSSESEHSVCYDIFGERNDYAEAEGEIYILPKADEVPSKATTSEHMTVIEEQIRFVQSGLATQTLTAELHISFPAIKVSPSCLDFGNVYLKETAVRYCTIINMTGFPTDFRIKAKSNVAEFIAKPQTGSLSTSNYNLDIGETITIEFTPLEPGYFKEVFHVYGNFDLEFDFFELFVSGFGTWNEKYKAPKFETYTKLEGINHHFCN